MKKLILVMLLFLFVITGCESSKRDYTSVDEITKNVVDVIKQTTPKDDGLIDTDYTYLVTIRCDGNFDDIVDNVDGIYAEYDENLNLARLYFMSKSILDNIKTDEKHYTTAPNAYVRYNIIGYKYTVPDVLFLNKYYDEIEATKNEKNKVKEEIDKFYNKILKQLTLEDDEDLKNYVDWIINNSDVDNLRIEH
ncbi:hypothetical protein [Thomasclavelia spiroformis]|uniref:hypothetical protein n=1 Tax=Thomasclavelia spiroformis TaxID=29348 RepID=UPI00265F5207|nr:hypothetical protein [Thomasclavelia spiroformis]